MSLSFAFICENKTTDCPFILLSECREASFVPFAFTTILLTELRNWYFVSMHLWMSDIYPQMVQYVLWHLLNLIKKPKSWLLFSLGTFCWQQCATECQCLLTPRRRMELYNMTREKNVPSNIYFVYNCLFFQISCTKVWSTSSVNNPFS